MTIDIKKAERKQFDKFYTSRDAAAFVMNISKQTMTALKIDIRTVAVIEPSAGSGAFLGELKDAGFRAVAAYDIAPEHADIETADFLSLDLSVERAKGPFVVIGNPPFGRRAQLAVRFLNHALEHAEAVAFILPIQMQKWLSQRAVREDAALVLDADMPKHAFEFDGAPYDVQSCFQIWTRKPNGLPDLRWREPPETSHPHFSMWQYNCTPRAARHLDEDWDFAVLRQGFGDFTVLHRDRAALSLKKQWILFKAHSPEALRRLEALDFDALSRTNTTVPGFGKAQVVATYRAACDRDAAEAVAPDASKSDAPDQARDEVAHRSETQDRRAGSSDPSIAHRGEQGGVGGAWAQPLRSQGEAASAVAEPGRKAAPRRDAARSRPSRNANGWQSRGRARPGGARARRRKLVLVIEAADAAVVAETPTTPPSPPQPADPAPTGRALPPRGRFPLGRPRVPA